MPSKRFKRPKQTAVPAPGLAVTPAPSPLPGAALDQTLDFLSDVFVQPEPPAAPGSKRARQEPPLDKPDDEPPSPPAALGAENKGFLMLAKMGFKPGTGLGKRADGRVDPILVHAQARRVGLGREEELERRATEEVRRRKAEEQTRRADFDVTVRARLEERRLAKMLKRVRASIRHLDEQDGTTQHELWPWSAPQAAGQTFNTPSGEEYARRVPEDRCGLATGPTNGAASDSAAATAEPEVGEEDPLPPTQESLRRCVEYLLATHRFSVSQACVVEAVGRASVDDEIEALLDEGDEL